MKKIVIYSIVLFAALIFVGCEDGLSSPINDDSNTTETTATSKIDTFAFSSDGTITKGKIFLPASYDTNKSLPAIYLIDYTEQHFKVATDEFEKVIDAIQQLQGFDALVVTLEKHLDVDTAPGVFQKHYDIFKHMALVYI